MKEISEYCRVSYNKAKILVSSEIEYPLEGNKITTSEEISKQLRMTSLMVDLMQWDYIRKVQRQRN